jgi:tetratricopeptide (TPR) repeat protein
MREGQRVKKFSSVDLAVANYAHHRMPFGLLANEPRPYLSLLAHCSTLEKSRGENSSAHDRLYAMSLRNRIRLMWIALPALWVFVWLLHPDNTGGKWQLLSAFFVTIIGIALTNILARRSLRRFRTALSIEDIPTARQELNGLAQVWGHRGQETIKAYGINILLLEERYQEALNELEALDAKKLGKKGAPVIQNQIAWCNTRLGDPARGIEISKAVLPQLECMGLDYCSSAHLVLGVANFLLNRPSEAVPHLEKAYTGSIDAPSRKATAAFYLGEALSALGKHEEARRAYQHAHEALPNGRFGMRAFERLK